MLSYILLLLILYDTSDKSDLIYFLVRVVNLKRLLVKSPGCIVQSIAIIMFNMRQPQYPPLNSYAFFPNYNYPGLVINNADWDSCDWSPYYYSYPGTQATYSGSAPQMYYHNGTYAPQPAAGSGPGPSSAKARAHRPATSPTLHTSSSRHGDGRAHDHARLSAEAVTKEKPGPSPMPTMTSTASLRDPNMDVVNERLTPETRLASNLERSALAALVRIFHGKPFIKVRPPWLKNPKTDRACELDFYNDELKLAIEVQGIQHYVWPNNWHKTRADWEEQLYRDDLKQNLCRQNGVTLVHVPFTVQQKDAESYIRQELKRIVVLGPHTLTLLQYVQ